MTTPQDNTSKKQEGSPKQKGKYHAINRRFKIYQFLLFCFIAYLTLRICIINLIYAGIWEALVNLVVGIIGYGCMAGALNLFRLFAISQKALDLSEFDD